MRGYKIAEAAQLLCISDDIVRRWIEHELLPTTGASPTEIPGAALAPGPSSSRERPRTPPWLRVGGHGVEVEA